MTEDQQEYLNNMFLGEEEPPSNCCSAKPQSEIADDNTGRCSDCKEGSSFEEDTDFNALGREFTLETDLEKKFNIFLKMFCSRDYGHLIDSDDNAGEAIRREIRELVEPKEDTTKPTQIQKSLKEMYELGKEHGRTLAERDMEIKKLEEELGL